RSLSMVLPSSLALRARSFTLKWKRMMEMLNISNEILRLTNVIVNLVDLILPYDPNITIITTICAGDMFTDVLLKYYGHEVDVWSASV
ncbi:hypothetical protein ACJX0J_017551, partial [Zea mays]